MLTYMHSSLIILTHKQKHIAHMLRHAHISDCVIEAIIFYQTCSVKKKIHGVNLIDISRTPLLISV